MLPKIKRKSSKKNGQMETESSYSEGENGEPRSLPRKIASSLEELNRQFDIDNQIVGARASRSTVKKSVSEANAGSEGNITK